MRIYKTSMDYSVKAITAGVTLLFAVIIVLQLIIIPDAGIIIPLFTTLLMICIYFFAFAFRPIQYALTADMLVIQRLLKNVQIHRTNIKDAQLLEKDSTAWTLRIFGVGGLFGYYGKFSNAKHGTMTWYATRKDRLVMIKTTDKKKIVLSPDEAEAFVGAINS